MDIKMPLMDGIECLKHLKTLSLLKHIPVVMVSYYDHPGNMQDAKNADAGFFIKKPMVFSSFRKDIQNILGLYFPVAGNIPGA